MRVIAAFISSIVSALAILGRPSRLRGVSAVRDRTSRREQGARSSMRRAASYVVSRGARHRASSLPHVASTGRIGHSRAMADADARPTNAPEITVSELAGALKRAIEDRFGYVRVRGEISGYRGPHSSGHAYFSLKDADARLDAVIWRTTLQRMRAQARGGARGHRDRQADHLPRQIELPDRDRRDRARRHRRADGAARGAAQETRRGGAVRRRAQAQGSVPAESGRRGDVADRRGHSRHSPPARRPLSGPGRRLAGPRAGRDLRGRGRGGDRRLQRAGRGRESRRVPTC